MCQAKRRRIVVSNAEFRKQRERGIHYCHSSSQWTHGCNNLGSGVLLFCCPLAIVRGSCPLTPRLMGGLSSTGMANAGVRLCRRLESPFLLLLLFALLLLLFDVDDVLGVSCPAAASSISWPIVMLLLLPSECLRRRTKVVSSTTTTGAIMVC